MAKRNMQDSTLINIRALQKRVAKLEAKERQADRRWRADREKWLAAMRTWRASVRTPSRAVGIDVRGTAKKRAEFERGLAREVLRRRSR